MTSESGARAQAPVDGSLLRCTNCSRVLPATAEHFPRHPLPERVLKLVPVLSHGRRAWRERGAMAESLVLATGTTSIALWNDAAGIAVTEHSYPAPQPEFVGRPSSTEGANPAGRKHQNRSA